MNWITKRNKAVNLLVLHDFWGDFTIMFSEKNIVKFHIGRSSNQHIHFSLTSITGKMNASLGGVNRKQSFLINLKLYHPSFTNMTKLNIFF